MDIRELKRALINQWERPSRPLIRRSYNFPLDLDQQEVLILTGVRRSGKSSLLKLIAEELQNNFDTIFVEFDDPNLETFVGKNFQEIVTIWEEIHGKSPKKKILFFDEIQLVEKWEKWIAHIAKDARCKIIVSGSNAQMLSSELSTLLTGRQKSFEVTPFHFKDLSEINRDIASNDKEGLYAKFFQFGGFPRAYLEQDQKILNEYLLDIIERDLIARHGARLKRPLKELVRFLCSNNTKLINRKKLASDFGVKDEGTIKRYCDWLSDTYLFQEVKKFSYSSRKVLRSNPKYYCVDPTFARVNGFSLEKNQGAFLENLIHNDLRKAGYEIGYYLAEGTSKCEVDFIARTGGREPIAVQVSLTVEDEETLNRELRGLLAVAEELKIKNLFLVTKNDIEREITEKEHTIVLCSYLGSYLEKIFAPSQEGR